MKKNNFIINTQHIEDALQTDEQDLFIGREWERALFRHYLHSDNQDVRVLYVHGTGGVGKSYLLNEYQRYAAEKGTFFLSMDCRDFSQTPEGFTEHLLTLIELHTPLNNVTEKPSFRKLLQTISELASEKRMIMAIDSYEHMDSLDRWFREVFVKHLPNTSFVIMAGRHALSGGWVESPAWRRITKAVELKDFSLNQTSAFLEHYGIHNKDLIETMWRFTEGHPLTLTLAAITDGVISKDTLNGKAPNILIDLTRRWLSEVKDEKLLLLIEAAALFYTFNQSNLSAVLKQDIDNATFNELTALSFVKPAKYGWTMHDLIRDSIQIDLKLRHPDRSALLNQRSAAFFYKRTIASRKPEDAASFFYHLDNDFIRSVFFQSEMDNSMYFEPIGEYNFEEVKQFFAFQRKRSIESEVQFYNRGTNESFRFHASAEHNQKEMELIDASYIKKINYTGARFLKNSDGTALGMSIIVPINKKTLGLLAKEPVSRSYFSRLNTHELGSYSVPEDEVGGWFIRYLDYIDPVDTAVRSYMLYNLFPLLVTGGRIVVSTPLPFFQQLLENFGFEIIPEATHYDYGENCPATTYLLDVRGPRLANYLQHFMSAPAAENDMNVIASTFNLTEREIEIVKLILEEQTNAAIAQQMYLAEITVKKHITRIFRKVDVKNRSQLVNRLLKIIS
ncbi:AAA ATPase domain-containing protein [Lentibacillus persicus]|uniref:AAA ATPase domain-containing protein n=1 Tax=Lentibacillus persicus TaxID=640948 RepID=A0A1I1YTE2_9BACI|nr:AAA family ATPase [Lentibacillus persicus]SFE22855.1 AAA ATPase domain-containing protein [Lentibacillus persicus]